MKWQQRVRVATGLSCWQIMLHLLVVAVLVMGWMSGAGARRIRFVRAVRRHVSVDAVLQRHHDERWRDVGDFLEELTTTWYFGTAVIVLWLLSRVLHNNPAADPRRAGNTAVRRWLHCWQKIKQIH